MQMKQCQRWLMRFMAMGVMAVAVSTSGLAQAASGNGPYYATPSWDQKLPAATRFVVLTDWASQAVLDRNTGLVWMQSVITNPTKSWSWSEARQTCAERLIAGQMGWRLPAVHELASLLDAVGEAPFLPIGHPFTVTKDPTNLNYFFWSATTDADNPQAAWGVNLDAAPLGPRSIIKTVLAGVWCVRGGMNAAQY